MDTCLFLPNYSLSIYVEELIFLVKVKDEEVHNPERCIFFIHGGAKRIVLEVRNAIILDRK